MARPTGNLDFEFGRVLSELGLNGTKSDDIEAAKKVALKRTARWAAALIKKKLAKANNMSTRALKGRVAVRIVNKYNYGYIWFGLNPVEAGRMGGARQSRQGVTVAGRFFEGAFKKAVFSSEQKVWRRTFRGKGSSKRGKGDGRFPVEKMVVDIEDESRRVIESMRPDVEKEFAKQLRKELEFRLGIN